MRSFNSSSSFERAAALLSKGRLSSDLEAKFVEENLRRGIIQEQREFCRSLQGFAQAAWHVLEPHQPFVWGWALDMILDHLQAVSFGQIRRLLINVPPGMMKSLGAGVFFPAWEWGPRGMPALRMLSACFNEDRAARDVRRTRDLVLSPFYQRLWPHVQLVRQAEGDIANSATGWRKSTPLRSATGERGDRLVIDDPHNPEGTDSEAERQRTIRIFRETVTTRLNNPKESAIIVIMQRLHENDISGVIQSEEFGYERLILPMEYEPSRALPRNSIKHKDPRKLEGELLFPERFPREVVERDKRAMTDYAVASQFQQNPIPRGGGLFKREWFYIVDAVPMGGTEVRAWDLAGTQPSANNQRPDATVGLKGRLTFDGDFIIEDMIQIWENPGVVDRTILEAAKRDGRHCTVRLPQDPAQAGKAQAERFVRLLSGFPVHIERVSGDKQLRARPAAAQAEWGKIKLLRAPWNEAFLDQVCGFPMARHDDVVDALSDLIDELASLGTYNLAALVGD